MKKISAAFLCICFCSALLAGCGKEPAKSAADSVMAIYDLYILGDTKGISSMGMSEEDISSARSGYEESVKNTIRSNFSASQQEITEEALDELCKARQEALSKMDATAETDSKGDGKATVVIHTTYFDEASMDEDAFYNARLSAQQTAFDTVEEQQVFLMNTYTQNLIAGYRAVTPSEETTDITVECVIQDNRWVPANVSSFGTELAMAVTGLNVSESETSQ